MKEAAKSYYIVDDKHGDVCCTNEGGLQELVCVYVCLQLYLYARTIGCMYILFYAVTLNTLRPPSLLK